MNKEKTKYAEHNKVFSGPASAVPCPWCGQREDWRPALATGLVEVSKPGDPALVDCDKCGNTYEVVRVDRSPRISLRQHHD